MNLNNLLWKVGKVAFSTLTAILLFTSANAQVGILINEASNGTTGTEEYYEMIVTGGTSDCNVDIRGWIIDDNNGDFSCGPASGQGIAPGHARFSMNDLTWSAVPRGALLVIYNDADINPRIPGPDPTDSNGDLIYYIPISHSSMEVTTSSPFGSGACPGAGDSGYTAAFSNGGTWSALGMRNGGGGDAAQVRMPGGTYYHGVSYGSGMNGGPDGLQIFNTSGSGRVIYFGNGDPRSASNYTNGAASTDETPGAANDANNAIFVNDMQNCVLPVVFSTQLTALNCEQGVKLNWATNEEIAFDRFEIERAEAGDMSFRKIGEVVGGQSDYEYIDENPAQGHAWYRLRLIDMDGSMDESRIASVLTEMNTNIEVFPNPADHIVTFRLSGEESRIFIYDLQGREVHTTAGSESSVVEVSDWTPGIYLYQVRNAQGTSSGKLIVR